MAVATLVSRITGLVRTMVLAAALGVGLVNDAYTTANTLPNIVYELLLGGVLTSVVVPLLVHAQERDRDGGVAYAQRLTTIAIAGLVVVTGLAVLAAPLLTGLYGITGDPEQVAAGATGWPGSCWSRSSSTASARWPRRSSTPAGVFGPPAWAPVLNNLVVIATGGLFIAGQRRRRAHAGRRSPPGQVWLLGVGTTLGIAVQALVLLPLLAGCRRAAAAALGAARHRPARGRARSGLWVIAYVGGQPGRRRSWPPGSPTTPGARAGWAAARFSIRQPAVPDALRDHRRRPADRAGAADEPGRRPARRPRRRPRTSPWAPGCPPWACCR